MRGEASGEPRRGAAATAAVERPAQLRVAEIPGPRLTGLAAEDPFPGARALRVVFLVLADTSALLTAGGIAYLVWPLAVKGQGPSTYAGLLALVPVFIAGYTLAGLYPGFGVGATETIRRLSIHTTFVFCAAAAISFVLKEPSDYSRVGFVLAWSASLVFLPLNRFLWLTLLIKRPWWQQRVLVVGHLDEQMRETIRSIVGGVSLGYRPVAILNLGSDAEPRSLMGVPVINGGLGRASEFARRGVRVAVVHDAHGRQIERSLLADLQFSFRQVVIVGNVESLAVARVRSIDLGVLHGIEFSNELLRRRNLFVKAVMDIALASLLLIIAAPVILLGIVAVQLVDPGPVFYLQRREGYRGRYFRVLKLRTMYRDAEHRLVRYLDDNPPASDEWTSRFKLSDDPRVLPGVGHFLRRFSIDELPQLVNVLRLEMSLVGPRPFPDYHLEAFPARFRELRRRVRPGMTGLWQVSVRGDGDLEAQQAHDTYYIRAWSPWLDLYLLARTFLAVIRSRGAY